MKIIYICLKYLYLKNIDITFLKKVFYLDTDDILAINASPLGDFHSLILPKLNSKLPQVIDEYSLNVAVQLLLLSASP